MISVKSHYEELHFASEFPGIWRFTSHRNDPLQEGFSINNERFIISGLLGASVGVFFWRIMINREI